MKRMARGLGVELGVVMLGVLLALGAESWRQDRSDFQRARQYVAAVYSDMQEFLPLLDSAIAIQRADLESTAEGLNVLVTDTPVPDTLTISRWNSGRVSVPLGTLDALIQTGDVNRISDEDLRLTIVRARAEMAELQIALRGELESDNFRELVREGVRARAQHDPDALGVPTVLAMRGNTTVAAAYSYHLLESQVRLFQLEELGQVVAKLIEAIEGSRARGGAT